MKTIHTYIIMALMISLLGGGLVQPAFAQSFADLEGNEGLQITEPYSEDSLVKMVKTAPKTPLTEAEASRYTLGKTDVINIAVMRHPEVSGNYIINNEGKIQYEFVGDIDVDGKNKEEVAQLIRDTISQYIINPEVTVKIMEYNSKIVYVVGEVYRPGKIFMRGNTITIRDALLEAGLPMLSGITKKSKLITPSEEGKGLKKEVNVYALLFEGDLRENFVMQPGDVLYIPPTFLTKTMRAITPVTAPVSNAAGGARSIYGF